MSDEICIGIDLGTTNSCVGVWEDSHVKIIPNELGLMTTPSYVSFHNNKRLIGNLAKDRCIIDPKNTIFDVKRLIGRKFNDPTVQSDIKRWPFDVVDINNKPHIKVEYLGETKYFAPEEISAMVLTKMKDIAENYLGHKVKDAVITVPAYFNDAQRTATKIAAEIACLNVKRIINEPMSAALAYGFHDNRMEKKILVFDLGGGTFDTSLLLIEDGIFEVKATGGNTHLGGQDIDNRIFDSFMNDLLARGIDINDNLKSMSRLRAGCEKAKKTLSSATSAIIEVELLYEGMDFNLSITRDMFNELNQDLFDSCIKSVIQVLEDGKINKSEIDDIILVGGSTRIIKLQEMLKEFFNGKDAIKNINPDEAVAYGAAIQGEVLRNQSDKTTLGDILLLDVAPLSLGIETAGGIMTPIISRNTTVPCSRMQIFSTYLDNQEKVNIKVYEGERTLARHNNILGNFELYGIPLAPRGVPKIEVYLNLDSNGILSIKAKSANDEKSITITNTSSKLSHKDLDRMISSAEHYKQEDELLRKTINARNSLEAYVYNIKNSTSEPSALENLSQYNIDTIDNVVTTVIDWLSESDDYTMEDYNNKMLYVTDVTDPIINKLYLADINSNEEILTVVEDID